MAQDKLGKVEPILDALRAEGAAIAGGDPNGLYIYAELDDGVVYAGVFKDDAKAVRYFDPTHELADLLRDAWEAGNPDKSKRWVTMEYGVRGTKFDVQFRYGEEFDADEDVSDRREAALRKRYGDKPVIYPPMPKHF